MHWILHSSFSFWLVFSTNFLLDWNSFADVWILNMTKRARNETKKQNCQFDKTFTGNDEFESILKASIVFSGKLESLFLLLFSQHFQLKLYQIMQSQIEIKLRHTSFWKSLFCFLILVLMNSRSVTYHPKKDVEYLENNKPWLLKTHSRICQTNDDQIKHNKTLVFFDFLSFFSFFPSLFDELRQPF